MQLKLGNGSSEFHFGQEICNLGGGKIRRACVIVQNFFIFFFSDKINQIGVRHLKNFHFSLAIFKNGVKTEYKPYFG